MIKIAAMIGTPDLTQETLALYSGDLDIAFRKVADLGYDGVELMTKDPSRLDVLQIRRSLDLLGLELVGLCTGHVFGEDNLGLVGPDRELCQQAMVRLKSFVDIAADHFDQGTMVNIGRSRGPGYPGNPIATLDDMVTAFRNLAAYAGERGVRIVLEPINVHQVNHIHSSQDGVAIVKRVGHKNFGLMLDVYHMNIEDEDIYNSFREAGDLCWFVHLADNNRHWPGSAHLNFEQIFRVLEEISYEGYVSLEILPWPDPDTAAQASIESLRRYLQ
ncbi:MAG TPA: sugar phosphate isomerase/epimerase family protein [candidate division Zixibacteria bacterium]|nr:sugar phosphate isomerase/epimerase family protein [candidate division Zixibacteria bacterium]